MSIYSTHWILQFPARGDSHTECAWLHVYGQGVPAHIGASDVDPGGTSLDPYASFLPPLPTAVDRAGSLRAMVIVREGSEKDGQRYVDPLLVLSGREYAAMPFQLLHDRICDALRGGGPRWLGEYTDDRGQTRLVFDPPRESTAPRRLHLRCNTVPNFQGFIEVFDGANPGTINLETWEVRADVVLSGVASVADLADDRAVRTNTEFELTPAEARSLAAALLAAADAAER